MNSLKPSLMGVLNATPDSFSDGGKFLQHEDAITWGRQLLEDGADILDIGGESTGPGSRSVSMEEELRRVLELARVFSREVKVSIDTYKAETARKTLECGASIINDVSALRADKEMVAVLRDFDCELVLMFSKELGNTPHVTEGEREYSNCIKEIGDFLEERVAFASRNGISEKRIILDPGMGRYLSPNPKYSWELLENFDALASRLSPFRFLVATSRKSFLGGPVQERDPLSQLTSLIGVIKGASIVRTHNPRMAHSFLSTWDRLFAQPKTK